MNIQPVKPESVPAPAKPRSQSAKADASRPAAAAAAVGGHKKLLAALAAEPTSRPADLERAKALAQDANYPSDEALAKIAEMFVNGTQESK